MSWIAAHGLVGLLGVALLERLVPIVPSYGLLVAIGVATTRGNWSLPIAVGVSTAGGLIGCISYYLAGAALRRRRRRDPTDSPVRWLHLSQARQRRLMTGFHRHERAFAFSSQLIPVVRLVAPGIAGLMGIRLTAFIICTTLGIALWNLIFIGVGYVAARYAGGDNASAVALQALAVLLIGEGLMAAFCRGFGVRRTAKELDRCVTAMSTAASTTTFKPTTSEKPNHDHE